MLSQKISFHNKRILVCPLDWGLGHTSRCVPIIKLLVEQNNTVIVACNDLQKAFLQKEVSGIEFVDLFGYNVKYSKIFPLWMTIMFQFMRLKAVVKKENQWLEKYLVQNKIDIVISDNRFGLYTQSSESIFITHQVFIKAPFFSRWINKINHSYIKKFNRCWVVDFEDEKNSLAGQLSHKKHFHNKVEYIGPLSRFNKTETPPPKSFDVLILLSGIEPQRTLLEEKLIEALQNSNQSVLLVRGTETKTALGYPKNFTVKNVVTGVELQSLFYSAKDIVCRSGYSSLMDLHTLGLKAILIPTPGQTEQEYLAQYWKDKFGFKTLKQKEITRQSLQKILSEE